MQADIYNEQNLEYALRHRLFVKNFDKWRKDVLRQYVLDGKLSFKIVDNGIILPPIKVNATDKNFLGGVFDRNLNFIDGYFKLKEDRSKGDSEIYGAYLPKTVQNIDEEVIYNGPLPNHFGHFILEGMVRFWYLIKYPQDKRKIVFFNIWGIQPWTKSFFELMGIDLSRIIFINRPTLFKKIIIPEQSFYVYEGYNEEHHLVYDRIMQTHSTPPPSVPEAESFDTSIKIYLSRSKLPPGPAGYGYGDTLLFNEQYFERFFESKGYKIIYPEKLSVTEQVRLVSNSDEVASTLGSLSHWALFCRPGTKFTMLMRSGDVSLSNQCMINKMRNINWYVVDASMNFLPQSHRAAPCLMGETKYWKQYVKQMYGEEITTETWKDHISDYVNYYCQLHDIKDSSSQFIQLINRSYELMSEKIFD